MRLGTQVQATQVSANSSAPRWHETFYFRVPNGSRDLLSLGVYARSFVTSLATSIPLGNDVASLASRATSIAHTTVSSEPPPSGQSSFFGSLANFVTSASSYSKNLLNYHLGDARLDFRAINLITNELKYYVVELHGGYGGYVTLGLLIHPPMGVVTRPPLPYDRL